MKKIIRISGFILFLLVLSFSDLNTQTLKHLNTIERIISLKPNITEILFALGAGDKIAGVTTWCDYPAEAKKITKVADYININTEKIIALKPDLVIGSEENSIKEPLKILEKAGIKSLFVPFRTMNDLYSSIEKIAEVVGKVEEGKKIVKNIKSKIAEFKIPPNPPFSKGGTLQTPPFSPVRRSFGGKGGTLQTPPFPKGGKLGISDLRKHAATQTLKHSNTQTRLLLLVGHRPLIAASRNTFLGEMITLAGAKNIVSSKTPYPTINTEFIIAKHPDVIIDLGMGSDISGELPEILRNKVIKLDMSDFRAGPRIGMAIKRLKTITNDQIPRNK